MSEIRKGIGRTSLWTIKAVQNWTSLPSQFPITRGVKASVYDQLSRIFKGRFSGGSLDQMTLRSLNDSRIPLESSPYLVLWILHGWLHHNHHQRQVSHLCRGVDFILLPQTNKKNNSLSGRNKDRFPPGNMFLPVMLRIKMKALILVGTRTSRSPKLKSVTQYE